MNNYLVKMPTDVDGEFEIAHAKIADFVNEVPLNLKVIERAALEAMVAQDSRRNFATLEQACVNYLRHRLSDYDAIIGKLNQPGELLAGSVGRHVLHLERRSCVVAIKKRILTESAEKYPWLAPECNRQIRRDGLEDDPGTFEMPFGPFKGRPLHEIDNSYLIYLLGLSFVRRSLRSRIEGELSSRQVSQIEQVEQ